MTARTHPRVALATPDEHPHGVPDERFVELFTAGTHVVFAFHGYPGAAHQLLHGRPDARRLHVRGYREEGTTTTPFDMIVLNGISRYHLAMLALRRARRIPPDAAPLLAPCERALGGAPGVRARALRGPALHPDLDLVAMSEPLVLSLNRGSSSLAFSLFEGEPRLRRGAVEGPGQGESTVRSCSAEPR